MANVLSAIQKTVSITLFNRGQAGKIFSESECAAMMKHMK